ncbi:hypothetical protein HZC21_00415 [Candidatus Peregrinibacteria bacterium]|nr:hypothetical protein [Candidatus Peregrinibacteria bacterium]
MIKIQNSKQYDLEERTFRFAKEARESRSWLRLADLDGNYNLDQQRQKLVQESLELTKIFGSIVMRQKSI